MSISELNTKYADRGLSGLRNLGNTCFLNSAIQCLSNTLTLSDYLIENELPNDRQESNLISEFKDVVDKLMNHNGVVIVPKGLYVALIRLSILKDCPIAFNGSQQDSLEFLVFFIDALHNSLSREVKITIKGDIKNEMDKKAHQAMKRWKDYFKDNYSEIIKIFYGQLSSDLICPNCENINTNYDPVCYFNLAIPNENKNHYTLEECFELYTSNETLDNDNQWRCDNCHTLGNAIKKNNIWKTPKIMIISLKRFQRNPVNREILEKNSVLIEFPIEELDLQNYCIGYDKYKSKYNLIAICNHSGSLGGGHYYAYCRNGSGKWYNFNDARVNEIDISDIITPNAYCLFYQKIDTE